MGKFPFKKGRPGAADPRGTHGFLAALQPFVQRSRVLVLAAGKSAFFRKGAEGNRKVWDSLPQGRSPPSSHSRYKLFVFLPELFGKKPKIPHFRTISSHFLLVHDTN